jgi:hypothetical protein
MITYIEKISFFLIVLVFLCFSLNSFAQKKTKESHPSKLQVVEWLNGKMADKPPSGINDDGTVSRNQEKISLDGKTYSADHIIYKTFVDAAAKNPSLDNRNIITASFSDLNPQSLKIRYYKDVFFISATTTNSLGKIKRSYPRSDVNEPTNNYMSSYESSIDFGPFKTDQENKLEERLIKALKTLIIMNGGKEEPF